MKQSIQPKYKTTCFVEKDAIPMVPTLQQGAISAPCAAQLWGGPAEEAIQWQAWQSSGLHPLLPLFTLACPEQQYPCGRPQQPMHFPPEHCCHWRATRHCRLECLLGPHGIELIIPFKTGIEDAASRKQTKYAELVESCTQNGFHATLTTVEVGSRGFIHVPGLTELYKIVNASSKARSELEREVICPAIEESFRIWCKRNWREDWTD